MLFVFHNIYKLYLILINEYNNIKGCQKKYEGKVAIAFASRRISSRES